MKLTFSGGAQSVTGSNYVLESGDTQILIDCGLNQGSNFSEEQNYVGFTYSPHAIAAVFVTHAHVDHTGRLPQLVKSGFRGKIHSTYPTKDMAEALLLDSEHLLREEAEKKKKPVLYDVKDIEQTMAQWEGMHYHEKMRVGPFEIELYDAGHILGSASVVVMCEGKKIVFSGDLGNMPAPLIRERESVPDADYALIESVYGSRVHENLPQRKDILEDVIEDTVKVGGTVMIPAFALERTQEMIYELNELVEHGRIPKIPVFVDSPLAIKLTAVYQKYSQDPRYFNDTSIGLIQSGESIFNFPGLKMTPTVEQSKAINDVKPPKVIMAGSGMSNGGRILHHEARNFPDPNSTIIFIGYQALGTLGRLVLDGAQTVRMFGEDVPVRCRRVAIGGYSAHADQPQLMDWAKQMRSNVKKLFVVQGEEEEASTLAQKIRDELAIDAVVPTPGETVVL